MKYLIMEVYMIKSLYFLFTYTMGQSLP